MPGNYNSEKGSSSKYQQDYYQVEGGSCGRTLWKCLLGSIFSKGDRELQYSSLGINPIPNFGLSRSHIKP